MVGYFMSYYYYSFIIILVSIGDLFIFMFVGSWLGG